MGYRGSTIKIIRLKVCNPICTCIYPPTTQAMYTLSLHSQRNFGTALTFRRVLSSSCSFRLVDEDDGEEGLDALVSATDGRLLFGVTDTD